MTTPKEIYVRTIHKICMVHKTISIPKGQSEWVEEHTINLSRFVQKKIQEVMDFERNS